MDVLSLQDVLRAHRIIRRHLSCTPFLHSPLVSRLVGTELHLKYENHCLIGSFKGRGALACLSRLKKADHSPGVVTASTGNHGQGMALAGGLLKIKVQIYVPEKCNPGKLAMLKALGASVVPVGKDLDDCKTVAKKESERAGRLFVEDGNEVSMCAGTATIALEMLEANPEIDTIVVPVGNGALISGVGFLAKAVSPRIRVIGVQAEAAPCMYLSWKQGRPVETDRGETFADGIATRIPTELSLQMMKETVDEMVLVSEEELEEAIYLLLSKTHCLVEGAGAAALAGALKLKDSLKERTVALILTGANLESSKLKEILNKYCGGSPCDTDAPGPTL